MAKAEGTAVETLRRLDFRSRTRYGDPGAASRPVAHEGLLRVDRARLLTISKRPPRACAMYMFMRTWCCPGTIAAGPPGPCGDLRVVERGDHVGLLERTGLGDRGGPQPHPAVQARAAAAAGELRVAGIERVVLREQLLAERVADGLVVVEAAVEPLDVSGRHHVQEVLVEVGADEVPAALANPDSCSGPRNGVTPGGTIVLNTTSAPLAVILSTVAG